MSKVLITHSYFYKLDAKQWKFKQPYPPLGTLLAASVVRQSGFDLAFVDANLADHPDAVCNTILHEKPHYLIVYDDGFNYLTKMCLTVMREAAFKMIRAGKAIGSSVIVCNSDSSDQYKLYLENGADFIIRGEGEQTLAELLNCLQSGEHFSDIPGIAFAKEAEVMVNPSRPVMRDLDSLPLPAWDLVDISAYKKIWYDHHGYFSLNIATTRGCPFKCNWCAKPIYGNRYNSRSPLHVVQEIEYLSAHFQPDHFWMSDDIFGLKPGWVQEFGRLIRERNLSIRYKIQSRVDLLLEQDTIQSLAASGAETVWVGAESGSQKILDAMDKGTRVEQIHKATKLLKENGIKVGFFLQFGYLGEGESDIEATKQMIKELVPDEIGISISYPLPGTKFYDKVKSQLTLKKNWRDSDDLEMMFHGTYSPTYYRILHRYIHNIYRVQRGKILIKNFFSSTNSNRMKSLASMVYNLPQVWLHAYRLKQMRHAGS
jgi:anaerobic magnesium-protoporphyrin IX monomethyl ester cyclase